MTAFIVEIVRFVILVLCLVALWKEEKADYAVKKEILKMNDLLIEQNNQIREQNKHLNTLIMRVCSKSVRERKNQEKPPEGTA